ncbi:hypothetical protein HK099_006572 [Clydaea vesicula]|uniref:Uncharacterized protein n=1 Tax=Clydaea vesicula TaxID=447962 RepID=A0AAD5XZ02_9FUNG|nr:hypothetical protein HK099_006572 [Clydaea vesicula]
MVFSIYSSLLHKHPIFIQSLSAGALFGLGDVISQVVVEKKIQKNENYDFNRSARFLLYGTFIAGPSVSSWYILINRKFASLSPVKALLAKVSLDQLIFAPSFIAVFFTYNSLCEGRTLSETKEKLSLAFPSALINNYKIWPG